MRSITLPLTLAVGVALAGCSGPAPEAAEYDEPEQAIELCVNEETGEALPEDQQYLCDDDYDGPYPTGFSATDFLLGYVVASALMPSPYGQKVQYTTTPPSNIPKTTAKKHNAGVDAAKKAKTTWQTQNKPAAPKPAAPKPAAPAPKVNQPAPRVAPPAPAPVRVAPAPAPRAR